MRFSIISQLHAARRQLSDSLCGLIQLVAVLFLLPFEVTAPMWVLGQTGALGIKRLCNGHGDVTSVSTGPPLVMDLEIKRPGLLGGPVERTTGRVLVPLLLCCVAP